MAGPAPLVLGVALQAAVVWWLWHRSGIAWTLAFLSSVWFAVAFVLIGGPWDTTFVVTAFIAAVQAGILLAPPVLAYVFRRD